MSRAQIVLLAGVFLLIIYAAAIRGIWSML